MSLVPPVMYPRTPSSFALYPATLDVVMLPLDSTILLSVTRAPVLLLLSHHPLSVTPQLPPMLHIRHLAFSGGVDALHSIVIRTIREVFCTGTSVVVIPAA